MPEIGANEVLSQHPEMVLVPGGAVQLGSTEKQIDWILLEYAHHPRNWYEDETPQQKVPVEPFMLDRYPVTNQQFADFVTATGYKTVAEQAGYGYVYTEDYWDEIEGAAWNHPAGPRSSIDDRMNHPVVHMSSVDAQSYAQWANKRLPTEAEWERATKGDGDAIWTWGDEWHPHHTNSAEHWIGKSTKALSTWKDWWREEFRHDHGMPKTTPVGSFETNKSQFGVYDLLGNVYEITGNLYQPYDPNRQYDPMYQTIFGKYVSMRGGSWMNFRYQIRNSERMAIDPQFSNFATGFRCAADLPHRA